VLFPSFVVAAEKVHVIYDYQKFNEVIKSNKPNGIATATALLALSDASQNVNYEYLPFARHEIALKKITEPTCALFSLKTVERENRYLFSLPIAFQLPQRLFIRKSLSGVNKQFLTKDGKIISLRDTIASYPNAKVVTTSQISYGDYLDKEIAKINPNQVIKSEGTETHGFHARMFLAERAEMTIAFSSDIQTYKSQFSDVEYNSYPIAKVPDFMTAHIMCNKTPGSQAFLKVINQTVSHPHNREAIVFAHTRYLPLEEHAIVERIIDTSADFSASAEH